MLARSTLRRKMVWCELLEKPLKKTTILPTLIVLLFFLTFQMSACNYNDESVGEMIQGDDDEEEELSGNDDNDGKFGTNECGSYGSSGCAEDDARVCESVDLTNLDRFENPEESACAPNLQWSDELAAVGLAHSKDMCDRGFFGHFNPDGDDPFDRMTAAGIKWKSAGENLAYGTDLTAHQANDLWMDEPICEHNHRSNLLSRNFTHIGIGVYDCESIVYFTQNFAAFSYSDVFDSDHPYCGPDF
jgi:Cysteine-rich secretory protein family